MKIFSITSGLLMVTLMILFFIEVLPFDGGINEFIAEGNRAYATNNYEQALETYKKGLGENSEEPRLNYNSGQASYQLNKYEEAIKYYDKTSSTLDKYINSGNSSLKLADSVSDPAQKQQLYQQALETYKEGILAFPQNVPLKYNYEYVENKLNEQQNNNEEQDKNENQQNKDEQENNKEEQSNNSEQNQQKEDSQENNQNESSEQKDNEENQQSIQDKESTAQDKEQKDEENQEQKASQMDESDSSNSEQNDSNIAQVLKMLEMQEQESLKNNQEVKSSTKEDEYDW